MQGPQQAHHGPQEPDRGVYRNQRHNNGVTLTQEQHEAAHSPSLPFLTALGGSDTFIGRLELFLAEMDRRAEAAREVTHAA